MKEIKVNCSSIIPVFKPNELAKVYYESDVMENGEWTVLNFKGNFVVVPKDYLAGKKVLDIVKHPCPFFKDGKCQLTDEQRPEFCYSDLDKYDNTIPVINSLVNSKYIKNIKPTRPKDLKNLRENSVLYYFVYFFQRLNFDLLNIGIKLDPEFLLVFENNKVKSIKEFRLKTENGDLKPLVSTYNRLNRRFLYKDSVYQDTVVNLVNRRLSGLSKTQIDDKYIEESPVENKDYVKELLRLVSLLILITNASVIKNKYLNNLLKDIEKDHKFLNYLAIHYLYEALTGQSLEMKKKEEISFKDLIPENETVKDVLKQISKINENILKVLLKK